MVTYICNKSIKVWTERIVVTSRKKGSRVGFGEFLNYKFYFFKKNPEKQIWQNIYMFSMNAKYIGGYYMSFS